MLVKLGKKDMMTSVSLLCSHENIDTETDTE